MGAKHCEIMVIEKEFQERPTGSLLRDTKSLELHEVSQQKILCKLDFFLFLKEKKRAFFLHSFFHKVYDVGIFFLYFFHVYILLNL